MSVKQDILDDIQGLPYAREVQTYLISLASSLTGKPKPLSDFTYNVHRDSKTFVGGSDLKNILQHLRDHFMQNSFNTPQTIENGVIRRVHPAISEDALRTADRYSEHSLEPDYLTGYQQKAQAPLVMGLAALYGATTGSPVSCVEIDYSNMRGTNEHFARLLARAENSAITPDIIAEAMSMTDQAAHIIASITLNIYEAEVKKIPGAFITPLRTGGDEARLVIANVDAAECRRIAAMADDAVEHATALMGLHDHIHTKYPLDELLRGFGACSSVFPLLADGNFEESVREADKDIRGKKSIIGQNRKINPELLSYKPPFCGDSDLYDNPAKASAHLQHVLTKIADLRNEMHIDPTFSRTLSALDRLAQSHESDHLLTVAEIHNHFRILMVQELSDIGEKPTLREARALEIKTTAFPAIDYATNTILAGDMPAMAGAALRTIEKINTRHGTKATPWTMGISLHNLAGLNETFGHEGANAVLHHVTQQIIRPALHRYGIADENFVISHMGGGEFRLIVQPVIPRNDDYEIVDALTMHNISQAIESDIVQLNTMPTNYILRHQGIEITNEAAEKSFSTIINPRADVSPREDGLSVTININQYSTESQNHWHPGGSAVNFIGESLTSQVAERRANFINTAKNTTPIVKPDDRNLTLF